MIPFLLTGLLATQDTTTDFAVTSASRLAITPQINGTIEAEEWDLLSESAGLKSYLQWEPKSLYIAGEVPTGQAARISVDVSGDGWLRGNDNVEITLTPTVRVRRLVEDPQSGGQWQDDPMLANLIRVQTSQGASGWQFELQWLSLNDNLFKRGQAMQIRTEAVDPAGPEVAAFVPRRLEVVRLMMDRSTGLPEGVEWSPNHTVRTVTPGEEIRLKLNFKREGESGFGRVDLRTLGFASMFTANKNMPFPNFDRRKRATVDYDAKIAKGAPLGFTRLSARLQRQDGGEAVVESSFQIADRVTIEPELRLEKGQPGTPRIIRGDVILRSNTVDTLRGRMFFDLPENWALRRGHNAPFFIYRARGETRMRVEIVTPPGTSGLVPIPVRVQLGERNIIDTAYLVIP